MKNVYAEIEVLEKEMNSITKDKSLPLDARNKDYQDRIHIVEEKFKKFIFEGSEFPAMLNGKELFEKVYTESYNRGYSEGFYAIFSEFVELSRFAYDIIKINKK